MFSAILSPSSGLKGNIASLIAVDRDGDVAQGKHVLYGTMLLWANVSFTISLTICSSRYIISL